MKEIEVSEGIVPLGEFKSHADRYLELLSRKNSTMIITQNGKPAAVLMAPSEFDRIRERQRFLESIARGLADAEAGRVMDTSELTRRIEARRTDRRKK